MTIGDLVRIVIYLLVGGLIVWLLWWLIGYIGLPQPFDKVARVVIAVLAVLVIISILLSAVGNPVIRF